MSIELVGATSNNKTTSDTMELTPDAATADGHTMIAVVTVRGPNLTENGITEPAGWDEVDFLFESGSPSLNVGVYRRTAASEGSEYAWTFASSDESVGSLLTYSGVDADAPVHVHAIGGQASGSTTRTTPDIVITEADCWVVSYFADRSGSTWTGPDTERSEVKVAAATSASQVVCDSAATVAAGTVSRTATASASTSVAVQGALALKPEPPPPAIPTTVAPEVPVFVPGVPVGDDVVDMFNANIRDPFTGLLAPACFRARNTSGQTLTENTVQAVEFDEIDEDPYAGWDDANPSRFVVPDGWSGWWWATAAVSLSGTGASGLVLIPSIAVNSGLSDIGVIYEGQEVLVPTGSGQVKTVASSWSVYAKAGDVVELLLYYSNESAITAVDTTAGLQCRLELIWDGV